MVTLTGAAAGAVRTLVVAAARCGFVGAGVVGAVVLATAAAGLVGVTAAGCWSDGRVINCGAGPLCVGVRVAPATVVGC